MGLRDNLLLVEGKDDLRTVPELVEKGGVLWGPPKAEIVRIHETDGYENMAAQFGSQLKNAGLLRIGVLVDANTDPAARWRSLCAMVATECLLPPAPPAGGVVVPRTASGKRLGVWMMPDNASRGMMETFLLALRSADNAPLLAHAETTVDAAWQSHNAPFLEVHRDKALIHTWLAWQNPPGRQLHDAVKQKMLDPALPYAAPFIAWFKSLYEIP
jgi:hypothetical protein